MLSDLEIARQATMRPIYDVAAKLSLQQDELIPYGFYKAKIDQAKVMHRLENERDGKIILVTAINPTPGGEGKTTVSIGLVEALHAMGKRAIGALREPSLGPVFGMKGGAAGGGFAQILPMEDLNLHFNGDIHAITAANNLAAALLDNHIFQGNEADIDIHNIAWSRCLDMNDRSLRNCVIGLGGKNDGLPRQEHFQISVASEVMAVLCLAEDIKNLKDRLAKMIMAYDRHGKPITAAQLQAANPMAALLKDALMPNLVQALNHAPILIHGGPFANIAHGCSSVIATKLGRKLADYVVTEAGFGADLGAEKFLDIKCRLNGIKPAVVVIVATVKALKYNGGVKKADLNIPNLSALQSGLNNLAKHIENMLGYNCKVIVAINKFVSDTPSEIDTIKCFCESYQIKAVVTEAFAAGADGSLALAEAVTDLAAEPDRELSFPYELEDSYQLKIEKLARKIYGAGEIEISKLARQKLAMYEREGLGGMPICVAKTQYSLSDQAGLLGRPTDFKFTVRDVNISAGAGFVLALAGNIMTMPGLPAQPAAFNIDIDDTGNIIGLF